MPRIVEGRMGFQGGETWYRVTGDLASGKPPLLCLHGGPGAQSDYIHPFDALAETGRAVIQYDQFGCGRSTHRPDAPADFWSVQLFIDELDALIAHLGIGRAYHVLGQSWGGMLGAEHAVRRPAGLRGLVIANSPANMRTWVAEANRLRAALPPEVQATLLRHEAAGTTAAPEYEAAVNVFYERHLCRVVPFPQPLRDSFAGLAAEPTVYHTMNGPSEFHVVGHIRDWSIEDRLGDVAARTLVLSGQHDEATEACVAPYAERIAGAEWVIIGGASHCAHLEKPALVMSIVAGFLARAD
jgi:L-proline amide hydrolase